MIELTDIHNHLIPAVDDGARTLDESLRHLRAWASEGIRRVAVTPHLSWKVTLEPEGARLRMAELRTGFEELRAATAADPSLPELHFGQEVYLPSPELAHAMIATGEPFGYEGTSYALIEFGFRLPDEVEEVIRIVAASGRRPVVSHAERYMRDGAPVGVDEIRRWKAAGALLQLNGGSVLGGYGDMVRELAWELLEEGLIDVAGSDSHGDYRPLSIADAWAALTARGADAARLMGENPRRLLADEPLLRVAPLLAGDPRDPSRPNTA